MEINATPDAVYICDHCEGDANDYHGTLAVHIDLGFNDTYTVCYTCAKNMLGRD